MDLAIDPKSTALVLIDLQTMIVARQLAPHSGQEVVRRAATLADALRAKGGTVVYVRVLVNEVLQLPVDSPNPRPAGGIPVDACEIVPGAGMRPGDLLINKRQWGAFYGTELDQQLRRRRIRTIILGGIATNFGVESTARAAFDRGFELVFAEDAMSSMSAEAHRFPVEHIFPRMGRVRSTQAITEAIGRSA